MTQLERIRAERDAQAVESALEKLRVSARLLVTEGGEGSNDNPTPTQNLLQLSVEAARLRCSVGEISGKKMKSRVGVGYPTPMMSSKEQPGSRRGTSFC